VKSPRSTLARGVLAGVVGATVIALWFLLSDLRAGQPFRTPAFLGGMIGLGLEPGIATVAVYTLLHYLVFAIVGVVTVRAVEQLDGVHAAPLGLFLGLTLFTLALYGGVAVAGYEVMRELGWAPVLIGNVLAGFAIAAVLGAAGLASTDVRGFARRHAVGREGVITGLVGAAAVALWFFIVDAIAGRVLFTPAAFGSAIFLGARSAEQVQLTASMVLGYTALHLGAFIIAGLVIARIVAAALDTRVVLLGAALLFVTMQAFAIGLLAIVAVWLVEALAWWNIAVANLIAVLAMGGYLYISHPDLARDFRRRNLEADLAHDHGHKIKA
jgi:hypothetical protein